MTSSIARELDGRRRGAPRKPHSFAEALAHEFGVCIAELDRGANEATGWPSMRYRDDPVAFFREVLGVEPWSRQIEVIEAVRDHKRVAVASGHKVSKSHTAAGIALWFYCSFDDARVILTSTTSRQVDEILWRELRMMVARARKPIPGELADLARSGLRDQFNEIVGFTAREAEAVAGISGKNLLYIPDEASGIADIIFEAIEGNRAGGARIVMFSNPTRSEGEFAAAFNEKSAFYKTLSISSEESPNVVAGRVVIPGLAEREWVEEKRAEWGEDSALFKVRVQGKFATKDDGKILSLHMIAQAEARWADTPADGRLFIGLDPAGPGEAGDESAFAIRRGLKLLNLYAYRALSDEAHLVHLLGMIKMASVGREPPPVVVIDREGEVGWKVFGILRAYSETHPDAFELVGVRTSQRASRQPEVYRGVRDELWANLRTWMAEGGAIFEDTKLAKELHAASWENFSAQSHKQLLVASSKKQLRKALGRSPDRADALALSVWETAAVRPDNGAPEGGAPPPEMPVVSLDPYAGLKIWGR